MVTQSVCLLCTSLLIEVINDDVLKGVVRYRKDYAIANIPAIAVKYRDGNNFRIENKRGIDIYRIEHDCEPEIVSEFFAGVSVGELQLTSDNALDFHHLSDFLQCSKITRLIKGYIIRKMNNKMMLRAWAFGDAHFKRSCENFIEGQHESDPRRKTEVFDFEMFSEEVACLSLGQLQHLINTVGEGFNGMLVRLLLKWLDHGSNKQFCAALTMSTSFVDVGIEDRVKYQSAILGDLEPELMEVCLVHIHKSKAKLDPEVMRLLDNVEPTLRQIKGFQNRRSNKVGPDGQFNKCLEKSQNYWPAPPETLFQRITRNKSVIKLIHTCQTKLKRWWCSRTQLWTEDNKPRTLRIMLSLRSPFSRLELSHPSIESVGPGRSRKSRHLGQCTQSLSSQSTPC